MIAKTTSRRNQAYFPENPYEFLPMELEQKVVIPIGTAKNGGIILWMIPGTRIAIFEWDEDYIWGPHYHVMLPGHKNKHIIKKHYKAGEEVPELWNAVFFD